MNNFRDRLKEGFIILDGATGSELQKKGMPSGVCPETWILDHEDIFVELQKGYIEAGSDVIYAPIFTCNSIKLEEYGLADKQRELTQKLVALSKRAIAESKVDRPIYIAGDITMTGEQLAPMGSLTLEQLIDVYKEQVRYTIEEGVDLFVVETMMSLAECRGALLAIKECCDLPVMVTLTYQEDGRTLYGTAPETAVVVLQNMGADIVGINCSAGPDRMVEAVRAMKRVANVPIAVKPNAGLPFLKDNITCYDMESPEWVAAMKLLIEEGATVLGGCCGTNPDFIKSLVEASKSCTPQSVSQQKIRALSTERNITEISLSGGFMFIGERINPTGKKDLQQALRDQEYGLVANMAEDQVANGAKILDVNVGMNGIDEGASMLDLVQLLPNVVDVPLCIDSSYVEVVENALRQYPGRGLINSISLEKDKFERLIPIAKKYGAMFILLPLSEAGLPKSLQEKKDIIHTILEEAIRHGLTKEDIIVDGLVTTIGANKTAALEVFETIRHCKEDLSLATMCGLSNISFGLPERQFVNSAFLTMAIATGLTMAIANPSQTLLTNAALASDLLLNKEGADVSYIEGVSAAEITNNNAKQEDTVEAEKMHPIMLAVVKGRKNEVLELIKTELEAGNEPSMIMNEYLIPGINHVGELFEKKKYFLPQLIASAETMEMGIGYLEPLLEIAGGSEKLATVVIATVKGDIHDIGKNLVGLMLRNYGYRVIDLGKDVESEKIIQVAKEENASIIGLSALMTTTMMSMKEVVELAKKENISAKIIIGGAVITESFANEIGADGYSKDAREAVEVVNRLLGGLA